MVWWCGVSSRSNFVFQIRICFLLHAPPPFFFLFFCSRWQTVFTPVPRKKLEGPRTMLGFFWLFVRLVIWSSHCANEPTNRRANMPCVRANVQMSTCMWCEVHQQSSTVLLWIIIFALKLVSVFVSVSVELVSVRYVIS